MKIDNLKMVIDSESVNIYLDNGEDQDPTHVIYWHEDEWIEYPETVVSAMIKAIDLYNNGMHDVLLETVGVSMNA